MRQFIHLIFTNVRWFLGTLAFCAVLWFVIWYFCNPEGAKEKLNDLGLTIVKLAAVFAVVCFVFAYFANLVKAPFKKSGKSGH